jgi:hypothetical protein
MGQHWQVLDEIGGLLAYMDELPDQEGAPEGTDPWDVRETALNIGYSSAVAVKEWQQALDFNQAVLDSMRARGATAYALAYNAFNNNGPLRRLGRLDDVERLLADCQRVFEDNEDLDQLGNIFGARALLETARGNPAGALAFQTTAIRYAYLRREPRDVALRHNNLANYLLILGTDPAGQRAHRLAAALIYQLIDMTHQLSSVCAMLADELGVGSPQQLPATVPEVIEVAEQTEGVKLGELITVLAPNPAVLAAALTQIMETAASMPTGRDAEVQQYLESWEPVIAIAAAAAGGDRDAAATLGQILDQAAGHEGWAALIAVLRRIIDGERDASLLEGLDPVDTAIAGQVLARLAQPPDARTEEDP